MPQPNNAPPALTDTDVAVATHDNCAALGLCSWSLASLIRMCSSSVSVCTIMVAVCFVLQLYMIV